MVRTPVWSSNANVVAVADAPVWKAIPRVPLVSRPYTFGVPTTLARVTVVPFTALAIRMPGAVMWRAAVASILPEPASSPRMLRLIKALVAVNSPVLALQNLFTRLPSLSVTSLDSAEILIEAS